MALKTVKLDQGANSAADAAAPRPDGATQAEAPAASAPAAAKPDFRKRALPLLGGVAALALVWFGGDWLINGRYEIKTDNAHIRADITNVASKVQGYVQTIHVNDNQTVKAGDLLVTLEANDFAASEAEARAALAQAEARVAAQQAAIETARGRAASQRDMLAEARAAADAAASASELSTSDAKRYAELAEQGWYPKARVEAANSQERTARAQLAQAQAGVTAGRSQLASSEAAVNQAEQELAAAQAAVAAAKARLDASSLNLGRSEIRAPIDGVVANRVVTQGQLLSPGQIALAIVPADKAYVVANFKETQVEKMKPGQRVDLEVDAYPGMKVHGTVESLAPATGSTFSLIPQDTATGNFTKIVQRVPVRIAIDKDALATGLMRSGLAVEATVSTKAVKE
jgi:membrane fusion protein (multidrug efflux system)